MHRCARPLPAARRTSLWPPCDRDRLHGPRLTCDPDTLSANFLRRVGGAAPRKTARQPNKFGAIASPDASHPGHQQYAVRRDGSGSVAHDDRMVLPDEEDRLIGQVVVGLLTDRVATVH